MAGVGGSVHIQWRNDWRLLITHHFERQGYLNGGMRLLIMHHFERQGYLPQSLQLIDGL